MDAGDGPVGISRQGVPDGLDVLELPVGLVGDQLSRPQRKVLAAGLQGEGAGVAGDHAPVAEEEPRGRIAPRIISTGRA